MTATSFPALLAASAFALVTAACSPSGAFCAKSDECSDDPDEDEDSDDGEDDVAVCTETQVGLLNGLRANAEPECDALALAMESVQSCQGALGCDDFNADDNNGECKDQQDDLENACDDVVDGDIDCESLLQLACGFGI